MAVLLALLVGHFLWTGVHTYSVHAIRTRIDDWQPLLTGIRWMVLGTLALVWPQLCCWWRRAGDPDDDRARHLMTLRWRIVGWLVAIELILGQGALVKAMAIATGHSP